REAGRVSHMARSRMPTVVIGAKTHPMPSPASMSGAMKVSQPDSSDANAKTSPVPEAKSSSPAMRKYLPPKRSASRPENGATNIETNDIGATARPALRQDMPSTDSR